MCCIPNQPSRSSGAKRFLLAFWFYKHFVPPGLQTDQVRVLIIQRTSRHYTSTRGMKGRKLTSVTDFLRATGVLSFLRTPRV